MYVITMYSVGYPFPNLAVEGMYVSSFRVHIQSSSSRVSFLFCAFSQDHILRSIGTCILHESLSRASTHVRVPEPAASQASRSLWQWLRRSLPLAALCAYRPIQNIVESDALEADTRDLEGTSGIQLCSFVQILRGGVLPARDRLFDQ